MWGAYKQTYAAYRGEDMLAVGTIEEVAAALGVKVRTARFYGSPTHKRRYNEAKAIMVYNISQGERDK